MIGTTISHYKIIEKIGEGGMGVVYKAHDTKLDRDVALKFLPRDLSLSEEERTRFTHEAKAASALDHPNICTIYEIDETPDGPAYAGAPAGRQLFIVMGYYEGTPLSKKIEKGRLDVAEAMSIAIQIAEGLQAAHEKGIVHRDIKSSNIIVSDKGQVRILDFGLARKKGLSKLTKTGTTVGTASYMSPEQARGESVDQRTDIWSLGVVLYEMVTGRLPFRGEHEAAILYSVVNEEPQPLQTSVPDASPELVHIIRRALEKDPAERYRTAEDMLIDLRRLKKDTSRTGFPPVSGVKKGFFARRRGMIIAATLLVLLCVVGYFYFLRNRVEINPVFTARWIQVPFNRIAGMSGLSPDGKWVVFGAQDKSGKWDVYVESTIGGEVRRLTSDSMDFVVAQNISPDGNNIVYTRDPGREICLLPFIGGTSKKIAVGETPKWSPDGKRIGYLLNPPGYGFADSKSGCGEFWSVNPDGTDPRLEFIDTIATKQDPIFSFAWSPAGGSVAWVRKLEQRHCEIIIHDLATHIERPVISDKTTKNEICWSPNNQLIYSSSVGDEMSLWMVSPSGGTPFQITKGMGSVDYPMVSRDGQTLLFYQTIVTGHLWLASLDGSARREEVFSSDRYFAYPDISPDGKFISVGMAITGTIMSSTGTTTRHLFIMDRDGTNMHQITSGEIVCYKPRWSPDGKMISYYARGRYEPADSFKVYVINPHKLDVPRFVYYGTNQSWKDSTTLEMWYKSNIWQAYLDGRPARQFRKDSMDARTICNGQYVYYDVGPDRLLPHTKICRTQDWDGVGPQDSYLLTGSGGVYLNYDALYRRGGIDIFRISFHDWKMEKLIVNVQGIDTLAFQIRTTRDGKEMVYKTTESVSKLGVIENLFK